MQLRRKQRDLERYQHAKETEKGNLSAQFAKISQAVDEARETLNRYLSFDLPTRRKDLHKLEEELTSLESSAAQLTKRKASVDLALEPLRAQLRQYELMKQQAEAKRNRAETLDRELSCACNPYEKAMVHQRCEAEFNVGSPRKVLAEAERDLRRIERDSEKLLKRAMEIGQKAGRRIDAIVIDGVNLCYENNQFIGLSALGVLIPILDKNFNVTVVFDAAIRPMAKLSDKEICEALGGRVQVHVVATKRKADETVLDLAEHDKHTYVLSNDRFGEYNDKRAVREESVLRHEIVNGRILIHDLGVDTEYRGA